mmetsp:Transcript_17966/g.15882  ORF Transcript_17966/g.15882 Transcript_17966/m.15882 type:complete len:314 (+) Transcript_17966:83-1024(+)
MKCINKMKEINTFCKKSVIDTNKKLNLFIMALAEMLKKGGNFSQEDLNRIALEVMNSKGDEDEAVEQNKIFEYIDTIKQSFNRWKNANLQKFQNLQEVEHKDVEMIMDQINSLQRHIKSNSVERNYSYADRQSPKRRFSIVKDGTIQKVNTSVKKVKDDSNRDSEYEKRAEVIILSERDINRDSGSITNTTENSKAFDLTPDMLKDLCKGDLENRDPGRPPKSTAAIHFEMEGNDISFARRSSSKGPIKIMQKDGTYRDTKITTSSVKSSLGRENKPGFGIKRGTVSSDRAKRNIFAKPFSFKHDNGSIIRLN